MSASNNMSVIPPFHIHAGTNLSMASLRFISTLAPIYLWPRPTHFTRLLIHRGQRSNWQYSWRQVLVHIATCYTTSVIAAADWLDDGVLLSTYSCDFDSCHDSYSCRHKRQEYWVSCFALVKLANVTSWHKVKDMYLSTYLAPCIIFPSTRFSVCLSIYLCICLYRSIPQYCCLYCT